MEARINERIDDPEIIALQIAHFASRFIGNEIQARLEYAKALLKARDTGQVITGIDLLNQLLRDGVPAARADYLFYASMGYTRLGRREEALDFIERCIHLDPLHVEAIQLRQFIMAGGARGGAIEPNRNARGLDGPSSSAGWAVGAALLAGGLYLYHKKGRVDKFDQITRQMKEAYDRKSQTQETYEKKMSLKRRLEKVLQKRFGRSSRLYVLGSSENNLGLDQSDLDLFLQIPNNLSESLYQKLIQTLREIEYELRDCNEITQLPELIPAKIVPILRFRSRELILVDLAVNNPIGVRNTHLLRCYSRLDERVAPLVVNVKLWAKEWEINDPIYTLSSYAYSLLVIHYLQCGCRPSVLPNLFQMMPGVFSRDSKIDSLESNQILPRFKSSNEQSLGKLLVGFFRYYSEEFSFDSHSISIKDAERRNRPPWDGADNILIADPFSGENVARSVCKPQAYSRIKNAFKESFSRISQSKDYDSLFC